MLFYNNIKGYLAYLLQLSKQGVKNIMNEEILQKAKEKLSNNGQSDFASQIETSYNFVRNKASSNRDKHFTMQKRILFTSIGVNLANILVTLSSSLGWGNQIIAIITAFSSALSITVTAMIAAKDNKNYCESWLRHQAHQAAMEFEIIEYAFERGKYASSTSSENTKKFQDEMLGIWKQNQENFNTNMAHFNK